MVGLRFDGDDKSKFRSTELMLISASLQHCRHLSRQCAAAPLQFCLYSTYIYFNHYINLIRYIYITTLLLQASQIVKRADQRAYGLDLSPFALHHTAKLDAVRPEIHQKWCLCPLIRLSFFLREKPFFRYINHAEPTFCTKKITLLWWRITVNT